MLFFYKKKLCNVLYSSSFSQKCRFNFINSKMPTCRNLYSQAISTQHLTLCACVRAKVQNHAFEFNGVMCVSEAKTTLAADNSFSLLFICIAVMFTFSQLSIKALFQMTSISFRTFHQSASSPKTGDEPRGKHHARAT